MQYDPVYDRQCGYYEPAGNSSFDASRIGMNLQREPSAMGLLANLQMSHGHLYGQDFFNRPPNRHFVAMFAPSCLVVHFVARFWHRAAGAEWRRLVERALAPVAIGMTFASGLSLMRGTEHGWLAYAITLASTALFAFSRVNPVVLLVAGAAVVSIVGG